MSKTVTRDIVVRWGDLDAFNHVNNTVFLRYLEEARIDLFHGLGVEMDDAEHGPVVVNINCNFRREIHHPATVRVRLDAEQASEKRLLMRHAITDPDAPEILYADAEITAVWVDYASGQAIPIPESILAALAG